MLKKYLDKPGFLFFLIFFIMLLQCTTVYRTWWENVNRNIVFHYLQ
jgi:Ca2+-dependent lipid-binding protein